MRALCSNASSVRLMSIDSSGVAPFQWSRPWRQHGLYCAGPHFRESPKAEATRANGVGPILTPVVKFRHMPANAMKECKIRLRFCGGLLRCIVTVGRTEDSCDKRAT